MAKVIESDRLGVNEMGGRLLNIGKAMALVFVIPFVAIGISYAVSAKYNSQMQQSVQTYAQQNNQEIDIQNIEDYRVICSRNDPDFLKMCEPAKELQIFEQGAKLSIIVGVALFFILLLGKIYGGKNRSRLAFVLSPLTRITLIGLSLSIVLQGALFVYGIYIAEAVFVQRVHFIAIGGAAIVALAGGVNLIAIAIGSLKEATLFQSGFLLSNENGGGLIQLVSDVADKVGAKSPDNIVVGLEPSFYVTGAKMFLSGNVEVRKGTTLYIPLPFLRILNQIELRSVIGHEMGHFKGKDTEYSLKFYPAYSRLGSAIASLAGTSEGNSFVNVPTYAFLVLLHDEFSVVERKIGREREIAADLEGARAGSAKGLSNALLKFSEYAQLWSGIQNHNINSLNKGEVYRDLSDFYHDVARISYSEMNFSDRSDQLFSFRMSHPNDTHPTLRERITALGFDVGDFSKDDLVPSDNDVSDLISGYDTIAEALTTSEHRSMLALGYASLPEQTEQD